MTSLSKGTTEAALDISRDIVVECDSPDLGLVQEVALSARDARDMTLNVMGKVQKLGLDAQRVGRNDKPPLMEMKSAPSKRNGGIVGLRSPQRFLTVAGVKLSISNQRRHLRNG